MEKNPTGPRKTYNQELAEKGLLTSQEKFDITPVQAAGRWIGLLTKQAFEALPDGTVVVSIHGIERTKGEDYIDLDARGGQIAFGIPIEGLDAELLTARYGDPRERG